MLFGPSAGVDQARQQLGRAGTGRLTGDRGTLDIARYFVSRAALTGVPIGQLQFPDGVDAAGRRSKTGGHRTGSQSPTWCSSTATARP